MRIKIHTRNQMTANQANFLLEKTNNHIHMGEN